MKNAPLTFSDTRIPSLDVKIRTADLDNPDFLARYSKGIHFPFDITDGEPQLTDAELSDPDFVKLVLTRAGAKANKYGSFTNIRLMLVHPGDARDSHFVYFTDAAVLALDGSDLEEARMRRGNLKGWLPKRASVDRLLALNTDGVAIIPSYEPVNILLAHSLFPDLYKEFLTNPRKKEMLLAWLEEEDAVMLERCGMTSDIIREIKRTPKAPRRKKEQEPAVEIAPDQRFVSREDLDKIFDGQSKTGRKWSQMEREMFQSAHDRIAARYGEPPEGQVYSPQFIKRNK